LVVIAIIAILASLLLPALQNAQKAAKDSNCRGNLRQNGISMMLYGDDYEGYPPEWYRWHIKLRDTEYVPNDWPRIQITFPNGTTEWTSADGKVNGSWSKRPPTLDSIAMCPAANVEPVFQVDDTTRPYYYDGHFGGHMQCTSYMINHTVANPRDWEWGSSTVPVGRYTYHSMAPEAAELALMFDGPTTLGWGSYNSGLNPKLLFRHDRHYNGLLWDGHVQSYRTCPRSSPNYNYYPWWPRRTGTPGKPIHAYQQTKTPWYSFD